MYRVICFHACTSNGNVTDAGSKDVIVTPVLVVLITANQFSRILWITSLFSYSANLVLINRLELSFGGEYSRLLEVKETGKLLGTLGNKDTKEIRLDSTLC